MDVYWSIIKNKEINLTNNKSTNEEVKIIALKYFIEAMFVIARYR